MNGFLFCLLLMPLQSAIGSTGTCSGSSERCSSFGSRSGAGSSEEAMPPHIILILADDLGWNDIGWNNPEVSTPILDALAADGIILNQNYMQPGCTPSRGSLLTGKYPFRIGLQHNILFGANRYCLPSTEKLLPELLQEANYETHLLGKWHLGFCNVACTPTERGFDTFYGYLNGMNSHYTHVCVSPFEGYDWRDGLEVDLSANGTYGGHLLTERAQTIIAEHTGDKPMFMLFSHALPHTPLEVPPDVVADPNHTLEGMRNNYIAMLKAMDDSVGLVVEALKDKGIFDNSIIIFSSDNGGQFGASSNAPLRGEKASLYEGGTRSPAMVYSPLMSSTGIISDGFMHVSDWFTTILTLAGSVADLSSVDGLDQTEMLLHGGQSARREFVYNIDKNPPYTFGAGAIRVGDYKLIVGYPGIWDGWEQDGNICFTHELDLITGQNPQTSCSVSELDERNYVFPFGAISAYAESVADSIMLFNIAEDPEERNDLSDFLPEVVAELRARLDEYRPGEVDIDIPRDFSMDPNSNPDNFGGIWSPGWC